MKVRVGLTSQEKDYIIVTKNQQKYGGRQIHLHRHFDFEFEYTMNLQRNFYITT